MTTIIGVLLIFVLAMNVALASTTRHNLRIISKIHHTEKKRASKTITMDNPTTNDDFTDTIYSVRHRTNRLHCTPVSAVITAHSIVVSLNSVSMISIKTSKPSSNNLFDIFIPPKISL